MAKQKRKKRRARKQSIESMDVRVLQLALDCYDLITGGKADTLSQAATTLGMKQDPFLDRIAAFERHFSDYTDPEEGEIFLRITGRRAKTKLSEKAGILFERLRYWLAQYPEIFEQFIICIGASLTTVIHLLPAILRRWRESRNDAPMIRLTHGKPQELLGRRARTDLVLMSLEEGYTEDVVEKSDITLPMYLICPNGHRLAERSEKDFDWELLRDHTAVLLDRHVRNVPTYPRVKLASVNAKILEVESYEEAFAQVMAGGNVITFGCPQVLNEETRFLVDAVRIPKSEWEGSIRLGLIRPAAAKARRTKAENEIIDSLQDAILEALTETARSFPPERPWVLVAATKYVYYVTKTTRGPQGFHWHRSELSLRITHDGLIKGTHTVPKPGGKAADSRQLAISGRLCKQQGPSGSVNQLVWRGTSGVKDNEEYACCLTADNLDSGVYIGVWCGRQTWLDGEEGEFRPLEGFMVVANRKDLNALTLNEYATMYETTFERSPHRWEKPSALAGEE